MDVHAIIARSYHDHVRGFTPEGATFKIPLSSTKVVGISQSRGWRNQQEDRTAVSTLSLNPEELQLTLNLNHTGIQWKPASVTSSSTTASTSSTPEEQKGQSKDQEPRKTPTADIQKDAIKNALEEGNRQVAYFAIFDGHGGSQVSQYLHEKLHEIIEEVDKKDIDDVVEYTKAIGGYFKRFKGGALSRWVGNPNLREAMTLEERATLAFLTADRTVLSRDDTKRCGSTASVALLHCLDVPSQPYFSAKKISLVTAHCGDTTILLCSASTGKVELLTEKHHAESRVEAARLRRLGAGLITDSFGESRWMGAIENTRSFGDGDYKHLGVTAEPDVKHRILNGSEYAYMVFVTDGVSSMMSNQEIVDLARTSPDPTKAAEAIVGFAEDLGAQDNCTCIVVPLAGWGKVGGKDETKERRDYRRRKSGEQNFKMERSQRM